MNQHTVDYLLLSPRMGQLYVYRRVNWLEGFVNCEVHCSGQPSATQPRLSLRPDDLKLVQHMCKHYVKVKTQGPSAINWLNSHISFPLSPSLYFRTRRNISSPLESNMKTLTRLHAFFKTKVYPLRHTMSLACKREKNRKDLCIP